MAVTNIPTIPAQDTTVTYHGSITNLHGKALYCGPCWCKDDNCDGAELKIIRDGMLYELRHVNYTSFS